MIYKKRKWRLTTKTNFKRNFLFFICANLAVFPFSLIINMFIYLQKSKSKNPDEYTLLHLLIFMGIVLIVILGVIFKFSVSGFMKEHSKEYSLLLMLGIDRKDFWSLIMNEYCKTYGKISIISIIIGNILSLVLIYFFILLRNFAKIISLIKYSGITMAIIFILYASMILVVVFIDKFENKGKSFIVFWEIQGQNNAGLYNFKIGYFSSLLIGALLLVGSLLLATNYETLYVAALLQILGIYFVIHINGRLLKKCLIKFKSHYYKNLVVISDLLYQYEKNAKVIYTLYVLNFLITFIIGGIIISAKSDSNYKERYPYATVYYGNTLNANGADTYTVMSGISNGNPVSAISLSTFEKLTRAHNSLTNEEILYYEERERESFPPLEKDKKFTVKFADKECSYSVKIADWKIIFGENIVDELDSIIVLSDDEFNHIYNRHNSKMVIAENSANAIIKMEKKNGKIWNRSLEIESQKQENRVIIFMMYVIGIFLIIEGQSVILIRQLLNRQEDIEHYRLYRMLGIEKKMLKKSIIKKIRNMLIVPSFAGALVGMIFLGLDCFFQGGVTWNLLQNYILLICVFLVIQYIVYLLVSYCIKSLYKYI